MGPQGGGGEGMRLVNWSVGKGRRGMLFALVVVVVLMVVRVGGEEVREEYALTEVGLKD